MKKPMVGPLLLGVIGVGILIWLGAWQVQRLGEKLAFISEMEAQIGAAPVVLPLTLSAEEHRFLPVTASGQFDGREIHVLSSNRETGAAYRLISVLNTQGRRVMVDRGFIPISAKDSPRPVRDVTVTGNLHWPDEVDNFTPQPDFGANIWFARDVPAMAKALDAEPVLIVARSDTGDGVWVFPVSADAVPNSHLGYAITWFLMAATWFGMTVFLLLRIKRQTNE